jgi:hypothetical protein
LLKKKSIKMAEQKTTPYGELPKDAAGKSSNSVSVSSPAAALVHPRFSGLYDPVFRQPRCDCVIAFYFFEKFY